MVDALDGAGRGAPFFGDVLPIHVSLGVFEERDARRAALLRTPVDGTELIDIKVSRSGTATPLVLLAFNKVVLEPVPAGV